MPRPMAIVLLDLKNRRNSNCRGTRTPFRQRDAHKPASTQVTTTQCHGLKMASTTVRNMISRWTAAAGGARSFSSTAAAAAPKGVGILAMDTYVASRYVSQEALEKFDGVSAGKYTVGACQLLRVRPAVDTQKISGQNDRWAITARPRRMRSNPSFDSRYLIAWFGRAQGGAEQKGRAQQALYLGSQLVS